MVISSWLVLHYPLGRIIPNLNWFLGPLLGRMTIRVYYSDFVFCFWFQVDWTPELHKKFVQAVEQLGIDQAIPSRILELMKVEGLTRHNVASHLQVSIVLQIWQKHSCGCVWCISMYLENQNYKSEMFGTCQFSLMTQLGDATDTNT